MSGTGAPLLSTNQRLVLSLSTNQRPPLPVTSAMTTLLALLCLMSLALLLVRVPCSSGNTLNLDLTKLCGNPDLG